MRGYLEPDVHRQPMGFYDITKRIARFLDGEHITKDDQWGGLLEILFWVFVLIFNLGFIVYASWRLAVKHTEATGSSVLVPIKVDNTSSVKANDFELSSSTSRRKGKVLQGS